MRLYLVFLRTASCVFLQDMATVQLERLALVYVCHIARSIQLSYHLAVGKDRNSTQLS